jgi:hypothetical protein
MSECGEKSLNGVTTLREVDNYERQNNEADDCVVGDAGTSKIVSRNFQRR